MKIAILSDIHSNAIALEAVLHDLAQQGNADVMLVTGDMFAYGPAPMEVLRLLEQLSNARFLLGNAERYLLQRSYPSARNSSSWADDLLLTFRWTAERLGKVGLDFLKQIPARQLLPLGRRQLLAVHGSPRSDEEGLSLATPTTTVGELGLAPDVAVLACGHTHIPMDRRVGQLRIVNAGSVGIPFDGDPRASYALIAANSYSGPDSIQVEFRRVTYDVEQVVEQLYARACPAAETSAYNLRTARSVGRTLIYTREMRDSGKI